MPLTQLRLRTTRTPLMPAPLVSTDTDTDWLDGEKLISRLPVRVPLNRASSLPADAVPDTAPLALYVRSSQLPDTLSPVGSSLLRSSKLEEEPLQRITTLKLPAPL